MRGADSRAAGRASAPCPRCGRASSTTTRPWTPPWDLCKHWTHGRSRRAASVDAARVGAQRRGVAGRSAAATWREDMVAIARQGLKRRNRLNGGLLDETGVSSSELEDIADSGVTAGRTPAGPLPRPLAGRRAPGVRAGLLDEAAAMLLDINPPAVVAQQVDKGYVDGQVCRRVLDPLDLVMCFNQVGARHRAEAEASPSYGLGLAISLYAQNDDINQRLQTLKPPNADALQVSDNVTLAAMVGVVKAVGKNQVDDTRLSTAVQRLSGEPASRWTYWRTHPLPGWLAKQAGP